MLPELQSLGLSEKEARIYLAALELGPTTAEKLSTHAKVNRSTTYVQLEALMKEGLISTYEEGKKTFFAPESPELLKRLLAKQKDAISTKERDLSSLLPDLLRQYEGAGERPIVRFFPGKEGITTVREEVLTTKDKELYVIFSSDKMSQLYTVEQLFAYSARRTSFNIHSKALYTNKEYFEKDFNKPGVDKLTEHRFVPNLPLSIDVRVFDDKTAIFSLEGNIFAMIIESKQIASSMKIIFEFLWAQAKQK